MRSVFNSRKPINSPADLKGMKIRTQPNPMHVAAFEALGALPTPIAYTELFNALQQKVIDGAENDPTNMLQMKFYEACKFYSLTEHFNNVAGGCSDDEFPFLQCPAPYRAGQCVTSRQG